MASAADILSVGTGAFVGANLRYALANYVMRHAQGPMPWGTILVNVSGCFAIGLLFPLLDREGVGLGWRHLLVAGLLGGYTTFSSFSLESIALWRAGEWQAAAGNVLLTNFACLAACGAGVWIGGLAAARA